MPPPKLTSVAETKASGMASASAGTTSQPPPAVPLRPRGDYVGAGQQRDEEHRAAEDPARAAVERPRVEGDGAPRERDDQREGAGRDRERARALDQRRLLLALPLTL